MQIALEILLRPNILRWWVSEDGPLEIIQFLILLAALGFALAILLRAPLRGRPWLKAWIVLAAVCCFYVAGEEISWGQWFFHWHTPDVWAALNDQDETNLHNTSSWLDQKPRLLLEIGVLAGGLLLPLARRYRPGWLPARFAAIYPSAILAVTAGIYLFFKLSDALGHACHVNLYARAAEVNESYMYYFVLLYLVALKGRICATAAPPTALP